MKGISGVRRAVPQLPAKLTRPISTRAAPRPRLFARLNAERDRRVVWIMGPPGSGKTVLVSTYLDHAPDLGGLWYQVDAGDLEPATFFHYLGLAAEALVPNRTVLFPALTPEYRPGFPTFVRRYFEALWPLLGTAPQLVLDNFQEADAEALRVIIGEAAETVPRGGRLLVLSRGEPPAALARLVAHGDLVTIGSDELWLWPEEAPEVARSLAGNQVTTEQVARAYRESRGWPAGFSLLLQQGSASIKPARAVLFEYFAEELFDRLNARTQSLLLRAALLPQFTAAMAAALGEEPEAAITLERLQQGAHFLLCRQGPEATYEFHPLYREHLLARAARDLPTDLLAALRNQGGDLLAQAGEVEQAAELFRESGNEEALSRLIRSHGPRLAREGRHEVLKRWLDGLGERRIQETPWLLYWRGIAELYSDSTAAACDFEQAYRAFRSDEDVMGLYMSWLGVLQTYQLDWFEFSTLDWWIKEFFELRRRHPDYPAPELEIELLTLSACLWYGQPLNPDLWGLIERAFEVFQACTDPGQRLLLAHNVSLCCAFSGDLARNRYLVETLDPLGDFRGIPPFAVNAWHFAAAMHFWMVGRARDCLEIVATALSLSRSTGMHIWDFLLNAQGAYASLSLGDIGAAEGFLRRMDENRRPQVRSESGHYHYLSALLATQRGEYDRACQHARFGLALAENYTGPFTTAVTRIALATALGLRGDRSETEQQLAAAKVDAGGMDSAFLEWLVGMTEALIVDASGSPAEVEDKLRPALALDRRVGGHSLAAFCGPERLARLYCLALSAGIEVKHVRDMIRRSEMLPPDPLTPPDNWPWPVRIRTLGRFEVYLNEQLLQFKGKAQQKPLQLLKILIAHGGQQIPEASIAAILWPDAEGDLALQAFNTTLHRLRKLLRRDAALHLENHCLSLDARYVWVDAWAFERDVQSARTKTAAEMEEPLALYRGPQFIEESESWALPRRETLRGLYLQGVERLGTSLEAAAHWDAAAEWYLRAIECHPVTESMHRALMRCYAQLGRRAEALAAYQHCRQILLKQLGVSPSAETQQLYQSLLTP